MFRRLVDAGFVVFFLALTGCAGRSPLDREKSSSLIQESKSFRTTRTALLTLYVYEVRGEAHLIKEHPEIEGYRKLGHVEIKPYKSLGPLGTIGAEVYLTEAGRHASQTEWQPAPRGEGGTAAWYVPTARKQLVEVAEPTSEKNAAQARFRWKWVCTKAGEALGCRPEGEESSTASFTLYESGGWRLDEIR